MLHGHVRLHGKSTVWDGKTGDYLIIPPEAAFTHGDRRLGGPCLLSLRSSFRVTESAAPTARRRGYLPDADVQGVVGHVGKESPHGPPTVYGGDVAVGAASFEQMFVFQGPVR